MPNQETDLQRFRYEGGDLDYAPAASAPEDWDGNLGDLIGDYFRAEDVEALLAEHLTPDEARELFSLWLAHGMQPPEIHPDHPLYTGAMKLGAMQPDDGEPEGDELAEDIAADDRRHLESLRRTAREMRADGYHHCAAELEAKADQFESAWFSTASEHGGKES